MELLKFIPFIKDDYYKNLRTNRHNGISNTTGKENIIYVINESI